MAKASALGLPIAFPDAIKSIPRYPAMIVMRMQGALSGKGRGPEFVRRPVKLQLGSKSIFWPFVGC